MEKKHQTPAQLPLNLRMYTVQPMIKYIPLTSLSQAYSGLHNGSYLSISGRVLSVPIKFQQTLGRDGQLDLANSETDGRLEGMNASANQSKDSFKRETCPR